MPVRHVMRLVLDAVPSAWADAPLPAGVTVESPRRDAAELAPARERAYPRGHVDWELGWDPRVELERILAGEECGPLLACSRVGVADGAVVGAALVTDDADGGLVVPPGLLVADLYRDPAPRWRGLGGALLRRALAAAAEAAPAADGGREAAHLVVTEGNDARRLYDALGFERVATISS
jgi:ribosomal protein S18 acetylase RimI-like enzyme